MRLRVDPANDVARRLYAQAGFRAVGPPISNGDGFVEMVNHLPGVLHLLGEEEGITDTHEAPRRSSSISCGASATAEIAEA